MTTFLSVPEPLRQAEEPIRQATSARGRVFLYLEWRQLAWKSWLANSCMQSSISLISDASLPAALATTTEQRAAQLASCLHSRRPLGWKGVWSKSESILLLSKEEIVPLVHATTWYLSFAFTFYSDTFYSMKNVIFPPTQSNKYHLDKSHFN